MFKAQTITIFSEFPACAEVIWNRLLNISTLRHITKPMMTFMPAQQDTDSIAWIEGGVYSFKIRMFGLMPIGGCHTIAVKSIDREHFVIQTHEHNKTVTIWNHRIELMSLPDGDTHYTDIVEIYAGWLTPVVVLWSKAFYRHRQRKWVQLLYAERIKA